MNRSGIKLTTVLAIMIAVHVIAYNFGKADGYDAGFIDGKIAAYDEAIAMLHEAFPNQPEQL